MKKKIYLALCCLSLIAFTGCHASYMGTDTAAKDNKVSQDFIQIEAPDSDFPEYTIGTNLYYAKDTKIVYWIGGSYTVNMVGEDYTTSYMTPWIAPNGLPYIYDVETNTLQEIK